MTACRNPESVAPTQETAVILSRRTRGTASNQLGFCKTSHFDRITIAARLYRWEQDLKKNQKG